MITTTDNFFDNAVQNSLAILSKHRTPVQRIKEYYGITDADFTNTKKLTSLWVKHTKRLEELGVSKAQFEDLFKDVLDFNQTENDWNTTTSSDAAVSSDWATEQSSVSVPNKTTRGKKS